MREGKLLSQLTFMGEAVHSDLAQQGYSLIEHGIPSDAIDAVIAAYANFTDNHPDPKSETLNRMIVDPAHLDKLDPSQDTQADWHKYRTNHPQFAKPGGYTNRSTQVATLRQFGRDTLENGMLLEDDPKEFYHFHPDNLSKITKQHEQFGWGAVPTEVATLHTQFMVIHNLARTAITQTCKLIEENHPELLVRFLRPQDFDNSPLRLVFYHSGQGDTLAAGHYDKSWSSLQIAESHMGLRVRNPQTGVMESVRRKDSQGIFFAGIRWGAIYPDSELSAGWHDVINLDELNDGRVLRGQHCARWALIWFNNSETISVPQKAETHREVVVTNRSVSEPPEDTSVWQRAG